MKNNKKIKNVYLGHTLEEYKTKYDIDKNIHIDKHAVDEFNKKHRKASKNTPLDGRLWWLIDGVYYEIDSITPKVKKHKGNKTGLKIALAGVLGGIGIGGALAGGTYLVIKAIDNPSKGDLSLNKTKMDLELFCDERLTVNNLPTGEKVLWHSSDEETAIVDSNGNVKGIGTGNTSILAKIGERELWCDVNVKMPETTQDKNFKFKYVKATENEEEHYLIYLDRDRDLRSKWDKKHIYLPKEYSGKDDEGVSHGALPITGFYCNDTGTHSDTCGGFSNCSQLQSVIIPEGYKTIDDSTFWCSSITDILIPNSVKKIDSWAFSNTKIKSLVLSENVETLGMAFYVNDTIENIDISKTKISKLAEKTFMYCSNLKTVVLNNLIEEIPNDCFYICTNLNKIVLPESINKINSNAFHLCSSLETINFSKNLTSLVGNTFVGCTKLVEFNIDSENPKYKSSDNHKILMDKTSGQLLSYPSASGEIKSTDLPSDLKTLGDEAFSNTSITNIQLPNGISEISKYCFRGCSKLKQIVFPDSITAINDNAFEGCNLLDKVQLNSGLLTIGKCAFLECNSLTTLTIPNTVTSILENSFKSCDSLTSINIPTSILTIGPNAFYDCNSLTTESVLFPESTTYTITRKKEGDTITNFNPNNNKTQALEYLKGKWISGQGTFEYIFTKE